MPVKAPEKTPVTVPASPAPVIPHVSKKEWYYLDAANKAIGPITEEKLKSIFDEGKISPTTYLWNEEMEDWKPLQELSPFLFRK